MTDIWARVDEAIDTDPLQLRAIAAELLARAEKAEIEAERLRIKLRAAIDQTERCEAAVARVRQMTDAWERSLPETIRTVFAIGAIRIATERLSDPEEAS